MNNTIIPDMVKNIISEEKDIFDVPFHWQKPAKLTVGVRLLPSSYSNYTGIIGNLCRYFGLSAQDFKNSALYNQDSFVELVKSKLGKDIYVKASTYGVSALFENKEAAKVFAKDFNSLMEEEYSRLDDEIRIKLLLAGDRYDQYSVKNVIFTSRYLAEHFIRQFKVPYFFRTLEIMGIESQGIGGIKAKVRFYTEISGQCHLCGKPLTDEFSQKTGIGPVCAKKKLGIKRTTKPEDIEATIRRVKEVAKAVGTVEVFIPKTQISKLDLSKHS